MIIQHNKRQYVMDMSWTDCADAAEAKALVKGERAWNVSAEIEESARRAVVVGTYDEKVKGTAFSAAMAVGQIEPNAVISHAMPDGRIWFALLRSGVPVAGFDRLLTEPESRALMAEHMAHDMAIVGEAIGANTTVGDALDELERRVQDGRLAKTTWRRLQLQAPPSNVKALVASTAVLCVAGVGAGAWWLFQHHLHSEQQRKAALAAVTKSAEERQRLEQQRQAAIAAFNKQVTEKREEMQLAVGGPLGMWEAWERVRARLPLTVEGYVPDAMDCTRTKCSLTWKPQGPGVRYMGRMQLPNWIEDVEPSTSARSEFPVAAPLAAASTSQPATAQELRLGIAQALQFAMEQAVVGPPTAAIFNPPAQPPDTGLQMIDLGHTGEFRIVASGDYAIVKAHQAVSLLRNVPIALKSVRWTQLDTPSPSVDIVGYWVHTKQ